MGDPAGVGPELCLRLLADPTISASCIPVVIGDQLVLSTVAERCQLPPPRHVVNGDDVNGSSEFSQPTVVDARSMTTSDPLAAGQVNQQTGAASFAYIELAIELARGGAFDAVTTGPINKEAWQLAGVPFPGHTELFADRVQSDRYCMMMTSPAFSCSLVTTHVGYHEVPKLLNVDRIVEVAELTQEALTRICDHPPKLVALGLNPHAGEGGLFGDREEERIILPALQQLQSRGIKIEGPIPPDTAFLPWRREQTDGYVCMYHDQGLIPFKAFNFDTGVNITLGLPLIRTSVDHGTALDIAWQGKADVSSLLSAVRLAGRLSQK